MQYHEREVFIDVQPRPNGYTAFIWRDGTCVHVLIRQESPDVARNNAVVWADRRIAAYVAAHGRRSS